MRRRKVRIVHFDSSTGPTPEDFAALERDQQEGWSFVSSEQTVSSNKMQRVGFSPESGEPGTYTTEKDFLTAIVVLELPEALAWRAAKWPIRVLWRALAWVPKLIGLVQAASWVWSELNKDSNGPPA